MGKLSAVPRVLNQIDTSRKTASSAKGSASLDELPHPLARERGVQRSIASSVFSSARIASFSFARLARISRGVSGGVNPRFFGGCKLGVQI